MASMSCAVILTRYSARRIEPSSTELHAKIAADDTDVDRTSLVGEVELREITSWPAIFDKSAR